MKDWRVILSVCLVVVGFLTGAYYLGRHTMALDVAATPAVRDTTVIVKRDTVKVPVIHADTVYVKTVDSTVVVPRWWVAKADTTIDNVKMHMEYNSPLPLSTRGFFSDIDIQLPPRIDSVRTVTVIETKTVIEEKMAWPWIFGALGAGVIVGALL